MKARFFKGFTLLEVMVAVLIVSVGFAGVIGWLNGHSQVQSRELRQWALLRHATSIYERSMAQPEWVHDSVWLMSVHGQIFQAKLQVLDSLDWPLDIPYRPWPREVLFSVCTESSETCVLEWFWGVGGVTDVR